MAAAKVERLLERVGLDGYASHNINNLSGGEAQRVSLARTLANKPEILLLDEPTSALDDASEQEVETLINQIIDDERLTCLFVTHDMDQALRMARFALYMENGQQLRFGPVEEVIHA